MTALGWVVTGAGGREVRTMKQAGQSKAPTRGSVSLTENQGQGAANLVTFSEASDSGADTSLPNKTGMCQKTNM